MIIAPAAPADTFDASLWLRALVTIGGGYALAADRRLYLLVAECEPEDLAPLTAQLLGNPDRQEAVRRAIEQRQAGNC